MNIRLSIKIIVLSLLVVFARLLLPSLIHAQTAPFKLISTDSSGQLANGVSGTSEQQYSVSDDGRYVVFTSDASNLVPNDTNNTSDVFLKDVQTGETTLISSSISSQSANGTSSSATISRDGQYIAFHSSATNIIDGVGPGITGFEVYVRNRITGVTELVSKNNDTGVSGGFRPSISGDGRYVAFMSYGSLIGQPDYTYIFVKDRLTGSLTMASVNSAGDPGALNSDPVMSADGRYVAFMSLANNLTPNDTNGEYDIFVHDMQTGTTERVNVSSTGVESNSYSHGPSISGDGRYVAFVSYATSLVNVDTFGQGQVYIHDRTTGATELMSVNATGVVGGQSNYYPSVSDDGRYVTFYSHSGNFFPNQPGDFIFRKDRQTGALDPVSTYGITCTAPSYGLLSTSSASPDGRFIAYTISNDSTAVGQMYLRDMNISAPVTCELSNITSAKIWTGLTTAQDTGILFDVRARVFRNGELISNNKITSVSPGGVNFANAILQTIPLPAPTTVDMPSGTTIDLKISVRNACEGSAKSSGTARLWYNGQAADSKVKITLGGNPVTYYLRENSLLQIFKGDQGQKLFIDAPVGAPCGDWVPFGTWSITY